MSKDFWDLNQASRGVDESDPEDVDDGEKYFEQEKYNNDQ